MARFVHMKWPIHHLSLGHYRGGTLIHEGDTVRFQVADIFLPIRDDLPQSLTTTERLEGTVVNFSDSGFHPRSFAVIDVLVSQSVIVPVEKLELQSQQGVQTHS